MAWRPATVPRQTSRAHLAVPAVLLRSRNAQQAMQHIASRPYGQQKQANLPAVASIAGKGQGTSGSHARMADVSTYRRSRRRPAWPGPSSAAPAACKLGAADRTRLLANREGEVSPLPAVISLPLPAPAPARLLHTTRGRAGSRPSAAASASAPALRDDGTLSGCPSPKPCSPRGSCGAAPCATDLVALLAGPGPGPGPGSGPGCAWTCAARCCATGEALAWPAGGRLLLPAIARRLAKGLLRLPAAAAARPSELLLRRRRPKHLERATAPSEAPPHAAGITARAGCGCMPTRHAAGL